MHLYFTGKMPNSVGESDDIINFNALHLLGVLSDDGARPFYTRLNGELQ